MTLVWFKRDLRLSDHQPMEEAILKGDRILLLYLFEPIWMNDPHYSHNHISFIKQSLRDLQKTLYQYNTKILILEGDASEVFPALIKKLTIDEVVSYQETGMKITYDRDKWFSRFCKENRIQWKEYEQNGVVRGIKNRDNWKDHWIGFMNQRQNQPDYSKAQFYPTKEIDNFENKFGKKVDLSTPRDNMRQPGGITAAKKYLDSFLEHRIDGYNKNYSKPLTSRVHSSRLSPYISWGNLSIRQVLQSAAMTKNRVSRRELNSFMSRLRWQAHFIQKFEMECEMEFSSLNKGYHELKKESIPELQQAWREGNTGIPMVDAAMRCLLQTGFINFRLRAMLASFFTHLLWQPWQEASPHLARNFLDFEPGIHFPQLNMQSGETGVNTIRIYNPIKNGLEHDPEGYFIKKWVPELASLPQTYVHEPWKMPTMEQTFLNFELGRDYPYPIVMVEERRKYASDFLFALKKAPISKKESQRIIEKHTLPGRPVWDQRF